MAPSAIIISDFDGALASCTKQEGLTLMEEQRAGPGRKSSTFPSSSKKDGQRLTGHLSRSNAMLSLPEILCQCAAAHTQPQRRPKLQKTNVEANIIELIFHCPYMYTSIIRLLIFIVNLLYACFTVQFTITIATPT